MRGSSSNQFAHVDEDPDSPQSMTRLFSRQRLAAEDTPDLLDQQVRNLGREMGNRKGLAIAIDRWFHANIATSLFAINHLSTFILSRPCPRMVSI